MGNCLRAHCNIKRVPNVDLQRRSYSQENFDAKNNQNIANVCASLLVVALLTDEKKKRTNLKTKMDFRKADPNYVNFVPKTCMEAIDLFNRHRNLGLTPDLYPECFVHCARALPKEEIDKFHEFIVCPAGDITEDAMITETDKQLENERLQLLEEATARDMQALTITEEKSEEKSEEMDLSLPELQRQKNCNWGDDEKVEKPVVVENYMVIS